MTPERFQQIEELDETALLSSAPDLSILALGETVTPGGCRGHAPIPIPVYDIVVNITTVG
jgi:hypothetical protein